MTAVACGHDMRLAVDVGPAQIRAAAWGPTSNSATSLAVAREGSTVADDPKKARARAKAKFAEVEKAALENLKTEAQEDGEAQAVGEKTSRLSADRLTKESAEREKRVKKRSAASRQKPSL